ncbi:16S rRNA (cytidine(1402)-2'-O)-methyltransferase [Thermosediminibacter oceani]|uniref:Ribosomal RNA small subunit methyltransferase I n=1 Tax=Thermosediminibacter oceani (strain ATCC BAA-1034 / DSM 16646 / JW/IW-1228P) TaxID=555079 RepID=D9RZC2_THEOJ|nr:16S rRNA (cytidine(1402)-2'-O)-methyltransferase [Thermosediminibacter oceani]ADL06820.1 Uroporphyrin-III C/tetrapyrrole (Corrin/Porphyrin) methyltransferase [Thermosediminibacter oceani DSM 16646]
MAEKKEPGILYLCPTPIGNLEDITLRVLRVLKEVDYIAAEDTRVTRKLLNHYDIKTPLTSYREHNRAKKGDEIITDLLAGKSVALVSDAGTPGISDPGEDLVKKAVEAGIRVVPLPGPSAVICAVAASGLSTGKFVFEGFLPQKSTERQKRLAELKEEERTIVIYEAPHRLLKALSDIREILGNRRITVAREMTKVHEEFFRGSIEEAIIRYQSAPPRGEIVLVLEGSSCDKGETGGLDLEDEGSRRLLLEKIKTYMSRGMDKKQALKTAAKELGVPKREAYKLLVKSERE